MYSFNEFYVFEDGDTSQVWAYNGEKKLASGIMRAVNNENAPLACLTNNHGEVFYDYELLYLLDDAGYALTHLDLYNDPIPENCDLIISYNPNSDLVSDEISDVSEIEILDAFLSEDGNSFWVFMENGTPKLPNYETYLADWGIGFHYYTNTETEKTYRYMVQDMSQSLTSDGYTIYGEAVTTGKSAEMLEGLTRKAVFKNATSMGAAQGFVNNGDGSYTKGDRTMYSLYRSGESALSWANGAPVSGEPAMLMCLTEQTKGNSTSYVGVFSSVRFSSEEFLQSAVYGNNDVLHRTLHNVGKTFTPEGLTIKPFSSQEISTITTSQMLWWTIGLALTPAILVSAVAVVVLVKRRRA